MMLQFFEDGHRGEPLILLSRGEPEEVIRLQAALRALAEREGLRLALHELPFVESADGCRVHALSADTDTDVVAMAAPGAFDWTLQKGLLARDRRAARSVPRGAPRLGVSGAELGRRSAGRLFLLERGAPLEATNDAGESPLSLAFRAQVERDEWSPHDSTEILAALLTAGARVETVKEFPSGSAAADELLRRFGRT